MAKKCVCKIFEAKDYVQYKIVCPCGCSGVEQNIVLEVEKDGTVFMTLYHTFHLGSYYYGFFGGLWRRITNSIAMLFGQTIDLESELFMDEESLKDYIDTLQQGYNKLKENKDGK